MNNMAANDMRMGKVRTKMGKDRQMETNQRFRTVIFLIVAVVILAAVTAAGSLTEGYAVETDFSQRNLSPSLQHLFGTDWMGRDMLARTLSGLSLSIRIGILTAVVSAAVALFLGTASAVLGRKADAVISWCIDLVMGIPHILLVMLISLACGRGFVGVVAGVALSHWPSLARVIRGELMQLRQAPYILVAEKMGVSKLQNVKRHMLPHLLPQFLTGMILLFPHAILHESSVTFLGFGLSSEQPAIGVILSESMRHLAMGRWWLAVFPGALLMVCVLLFRVLGESVCRLIDPGSVHQ